MNRQPIRFLIMSTVPFVLVVSIGLLAWLGNLVDNRLGTSPWFTALGIIVGAVVGTLEVINLLRQAQD